MTWTEFFSLISGIGLALFVGAVFHGVKSLVRYISGDMRNTFWIFMIGWLLGWWMSLAFNRLVQAYGWQDAPKAVNAAVKARKP